MINHLLLICSSILIYEFIRYFNFINIAKFNLKIYQKILKLIKFKNVSDFRKEILIFNYSKSLLIISVKIILIILLIIIFMFALNLLSHSFLDLIFSIFGIIEFSVVLTIYHNFRKKIYAKL